MTIKEATDWANLQDVVQLQHDLRECRERERTIADQLREFRRIIADAKRAINEPLDRLDQFARRMLGDKE